MAKQTLKINALNEWKKDRKIVVKVVKDDDDNDKSSKKHGK